MIGRVDKLGAVNRTKINVEFTQKFNYLRVQADYIMLWVDCNVVDVNGNV